MYLILFVLHNENRLPALLDAWDLAGVGGVTILPSTGMGRLKKNMPLREEIPLIPSLNDLLQDHEQLRNQTLFTIVDSMEAAEKIAAITDEVAGPLDQPDTGILAVLPLAKVYGLRLR